MGFVYTPKIIRALFLTFLALIKFHEIKFYFMKLIVINWIQNSTLDTDKCFENDLITLNSNSQHKLFLGFEFLFFMIN